MPDLGRTRQDFPSRKYRHRYAAPAGFAAAEALTAGEAYRFVLGRDALPVPINAGDANLPRDVFATHVLFGAGPRPVTLRGLRTTLDAIAPGAALPVERSFVVADGGQIPWKPETDDLERSFRLLITRQGSAASQPDLLISSSTDFESDTAFLQVLAWDETAGAYQFYDRRGGAWVWAGSSWDALAPDSRGQGPFDSHINGALNMKELKRPWVHWHSQASPILDTALAPGDPLRNEPLWTGRVQAEEFERTVARPGIERWTAARFARCIDSGRLSRLPEFMRQVLETTTINLASSPMSNASLATAMSVQLPLTFFFNADALIDRIGLEPAVAVPRVDAAVYREILQDFDVGLTDGQRSPPESSTLRHRIAGDTHFIFVVPEPAFEDVVVLEGLLTHGVLSKRLAAAILMVDFCNPVFSRRRAALMRYVPGETATGDPEAFERDLIRAVRTSPAAADPDSPEAQLLANCDLPQDGWQTEFEERIVRFMTAVAARLTSVQSFKPVFQLAESRRREFRMRKLAEFRLTTPITGIPENAPLLEFTADGGVRPKP